MENTQRKKEREWRVKKEDNERKISADEQEKEEKDLSGGKNEDTVRSEPKMKKLKVLLKVSHGLSS